jgi:hypothetical protein
MKTEKSFKTLFFLLIPILIILGLYIAPLIAGPGATDDPIVSLSYLQIANRYSTVPVMKGDEFPLPDGTSFILFDGSVEIRGTGDYFVIDITAGKKYKRGKDIAESHLYVVTGGSDLKIAAKENAKILIRGGDTQMLRKAMN